MDIWQKIKHLLVTNNIEEQVMLKNFLLYNESDVKPYKTHDITILKVIGKK